ncbi:MAG: hypothetical protein MUO77_09765 [Anaerolineales bacterium]|nr:hypothetical protein [Anaerolineales bacterium]
MSKLDQDLQYLDTGLSDLQDYLLSKELYWPLSASASLPRLTLGGLLLARQRLGPRADSQAAQIEAIRSKWRTAWDAKASREVRARSDLWTNYLQDYRESPESHVSEYAQQVRNRAMLALLGEESNLFDESIKGMFVSGDFIWESECAEFFSRDTFWFLYGKLK